MGLTNTIHKTIRAFIRNQSLLKRTQQLLLLLGVGMALLLLLLVILPIIIPSLQGRDFSFVIGNLSLSLVGIAIYYAVFSFASMNIRSKAEQQEEHIRELEHELTIINFRLGRVGSIEEEQDLSEQYDQVKLKRDLLISKSPRGWEEEISSHWIKTFVASRKRLLDEEDRLQVRNTKNLQTGIVLAFVGATFPFMYLCYMLYVAISPIGGEGNNFVLPFSTYLPIISIVLIFEVIAFFFLNLYASNERKIERNKSDLTNVELRLAAGLMLYDDRNKRNFAILADNISKEDSKFILGKNESAGGISANKLLETLLKLTPTGGG